MICSEESTGRVEIKPTEPYFTAKAHAECAVSVHTGGFSGFGFAWFRRADLEHFRSELKRLDQEKLGACSLIGRSPTGASVCTLTIRATDRPGPLELNIDITNHEHGEDGQEYFHHHIQTGFGIDPGSLSQIQRDLEILLDHLFNGDVAFVREPPDHPQPLDPTWPGLSWRFLARDWRNPGREVYHLTSDGFTWFDELVVGDWLHIEHMNGRHWWMRLGDAMINVTIPKGRPSIIRIERDNYYQRPSPEEEAQYLDEGDVEADPFEPIEDDE